MPASDSGGLAAALQTVCGERRWARWTWRPTSRAAAWWPLT